MLKILGSLGPTVSPVPPTTNVINHTVFLTSGKSLFPVHLYNAGGGSTAQGNTYLPCVILTTVAGTEFDCFVLKHKWYYCLYCLCSHMKQHIGEDYGWLQKKGEVNPSSPSFAHSQQVYLPLVYN